MVQLPSHPLDWASTLQKPPKMLSSQSNQIIMYNYMQPDLPKGSYMCIYYYLLMVTEICRLTYKCVLLPKIRQSAFSQTCLSNLSDLCKCTSDLTKVSNNWLVNLAIDLYSNIVRYEITIKIDNQ